MFFSMISSWWRSIATATSARSNGWRADDPCYILTAEYETARAGSEQGCGWLSGAVGCSIRRWSALASACSRRAPKSRHRRRRKWRWRRCSRRHHRRARSRVRPASGAQARAASRDRRARRRRAATPAAAIVEPDAATHPPAAGSGSAIARADRARPAGGRAPVRRRRRAIRPAARHGMAVSKTPPASSTCYFYLDLRSGRMRTLHYAFNGDAADPAGRQNCLTITGRRPRKLELIAIDAASASGR